MSKVIYYQSGSGTLNDIKTVDLAINARGVAIADNNGDGKPDLVITGATNDQGQGYLERLVVYLQDPTTGELLPPREYTVSSYSRGTVAVGDLNGDGRNDVAVYAPGVGFSMFLQQADGTLGPEIVYDKVNKGAIIDGEIHIGDVTGDGRNDIVLQSGRTEVAVIRQTAPGVFSPTPELYDVQAVPWNFYTFALGDVNGDGRTDIVALDSASGSLNIFTQNAQGTLDRSVVAEGNTAFGIYIADITGDGLNDIVLDGVGGLRVFPQQKDHAFATNVLYTYTNPLRTATSWIINNWGSSQALSFGDVTGDGKPDMVSTRENEGVYTFSPCAQLSQK